ncbi:MAG: oligopeptide ABC transporter permease [Acidobacteriota bacterium]
MSVARGTETFAELTWRRFLRHRPAVAALAILAILGLVASLAPWIAPYGRDDQNLDAMLVPPSAHHFFGTDALGRDVFSRILHGGRISLFVGLTVMLVALFIGVLLGVASGYYGGFLDALVMRGVDLMLSIPLFFVLLLLAARFEPSLGLLVFSLGLTSWMAVTRLVRASFLSLREKEFVEAARALGSRDGNIIFGHILPNCLAPIMVAATLGVAEAILVESALSFLGFGIQPPTPSWGNMLEDAQEFMSSAPWLAVFPGFMIFLTVLCLNFLGDGLRDALDPRLRSN